jgi:uncharacterized protein (TIGR02147 family)
MAQLFDFIDYRKFLIAALGEQNKLRRGARTRLAQAIGCQPSYLSQVLGGTADLTLEHAGRANVFWGHSDEQSSYFLLLVNHARSGTDVLRGQFFRAIEKERNQYWTLRQRLQTKKKLSPEAQQIYYSSWQYAAVMMALTVPSLRSKEALVSHFKFSAKRTSEILDFLTAAGLAQAKGQVYLPGESWIHIGSDSDLAKKDDLNWRLKSIQSLEALSPADFRYHSVVSLSEADFQLVRTKLIQVLEEIRKIIRDSKEEKVASLIIDLFNV